ncbi:EAL and HDOD domain-containing protein [Methylomarinum vadi]|uniref:EAL and HDOD domain-containing protein n=1 Tax=Methylomarinum vadi TaxID=438855 RepID=UPI0004DFA8C7|nr:HDOD domain-containing protein [Methylomarinum vadi]
MSDILIGRQQILDSHQNIYAYEILFRGQDFDLSHKDEAADATNQVITDTLLEIGLNELVGPGKAFINFTARNLLEKTPLSLPKDRIVIEVLENITIDQAIIDALKEFSRQGYTIALDDFVLKPEWLPLLKIADIIKLDIKAMPLPKTLALIEKLKRFSLTLLAEKVETHAEFEALKAAGCMLFQGFFFSKPHLVSGKRLSVNQAAAIRLLTKINQPEVGFDELGNIISHDVGLSYKLLRYINSAFFSLPNKIESIKHALTYLGMNEIKRWINILTLTSLSNKPNALFQQILIRGKMCELLAKQYNEAPEHLFLIGLLSSLDSLLDIPLEEALNQLPLTEDVYQAILHHSGIGGEILSYVICYERWELSSKHFSQISPKNIGQIYLQSISWADDVLDNINC